MSTSLVNDYLSKGYPLKARDRLEIRKEIRKFVEERFKKYKSVIFEKPPIDADVIGSILGVKFKEGELDKDISAELRFSPEKGFHYLAIINSLIDNEHHKRFSKFHECSHVMMNLFDNDGRAFRTPMNNQNSTFFSKDPREVICDITASEMLFYYPLFSEELSSFTPDNECCDRIEKIAECFNASLEATTRTLVENYPQKAFMLVIKENYRKEELSIINNQEKMSSLKENEKPVPKPRIAYAVVNDKVNFYIHKNKSFAEDTIVHRCFYNNCKETDIIDLSSFGWGEGKFVVSVIPEEDRCFCVGIEK